MIVLKCKFESFQYNQKMKGVNFNKKVNLFNSGNSNFRAYCRRIVKNLPLHNKNFWVRGGAYEHSG